MIERDVVTKIPMYILTDLHHFSSPMSSYLTHNQSGFGDHGSLWSTYHSLGFSLMNFFISSSHLLFCNTTTSMPFCFR
jgi:hypothetical protein